MPNVGDYETEKDWIGACVPAMIGEGKDQDQSVAACMSMWANKDKATKDAPPGHDFYGNQFTGGGGGGSSGGPLGGGSSSSGGSGWKTPHDEFRFVQRRLAAPGLKKGERRMLERRSERLAKQVLGVTD